LKQGRKGYVVVIAEAIAHEQWGETKAQEPKPKHRTKDSQKLFSPQFTSADPSPFIGRRTDFLHSENTLVWNGSKQNVLGYFWEISN
jgi:hypothetical protein